MVTAVVTIDKWSLVRHFCHSRACSLELPVAAIGGEAGEEKAETEMSTEDRKKGKNQVDPDIILEELIRFLAPGAIWNGDGDSSGSKLAECHTLLSQMDYIRERGGVNDTISDLLSQEGETSGSYTEALQEWVEAHADKVIDGSKVENLQKHKESNNVYSPSTKTIVQATVLDDKGSSKGMYMLLMCVFMYMCTFEYKIGHATIIMYRVMNNY